MIYDDASFTNEKQEVVPAPSKVDQVFSIASLFELASGFPPRPVIDSQIITHLSATKNGIRLSETFYNYFFGVRWMPKLNTQG
jgi:hypothetical protein